MNICQLLHSMSTGGAEVLANRMGRAFADRHHVVYACLDQVGELGESLRSDGFVVEQFDRGPGLDIGCMRRLASFVKRHGIDLIHAHQYTPFFYAAGSRLVGPSRPIVFTEHGRFFPDLPSRKRAVYNRLMLRKHDHVIAVGEHVKRALIENESIPANRIGVIYNGVDLEPFAGANAGDRLALRQELGIAADATVVAQVARLDPIKDHATAIKAIAHANTQSQSQSLHLAIIGEGQARAEIEAVIAAEQLNDHVHLLGLRRDVPAILKGADIVLLTSVSEGIPLTLIEAMACGLPCVTTDVGGVREVVNEECARLAPAADWSQLGDALATLAADPELRDRLGKSGQQVAHARFSEQQMLAGYDELFQSVSVALPAADFTALADR